MHTTYTSHGTYFFYLYFPFFNKMLHHSCRFFVNKKYFVDTQKLYLYNNNKSKITRYENSVADRKNVDNLMVS